jgi:hypothetical protein
MCRVLHVARNSWYDWCLRHHQLNHRILNTIVAHYPLISIHYLMSKQLRTSVSRPETFDKLFMA